MKTYIPMFNVGYEIIIKARYTYKKSEVMLFKGHDVEVTFTTDVAFRYQSESYFT